MAGERRGRMEGRSREGTAAGEGERSAVVGGAAAAAVAVAVAVAGQEVGFCVAAKLVREQGPERARACQIPEFPLVAHSLSTLPFPFSLGIHFDASLPLINLLSEKKKTTV